MSKSFDELPSEEKLKELDKIMGTDIAGATEKHEQGVPLEEVLKTAFGKQLA
jgi:hypothetical protein